MILMLNKIMQSNIKNTTPPKKKSSTRGGYRPGAGRPKGTTNKLRIEDLLGSIETQLNMPFAQRIALNYVEAISRGDTAGVRDYDKILLGKLVADKQELEVTNTQDAVEAKREAFADAVAALSANNVKTIVPSKSDATVMSTVSNTVKGDGTNG